MLKSIKEFLQSDKLLFINHAFIVLCSTFILSDLLFSSRKSSKLQSKQHVKSISNNKKNAKKPNHDKNDKSSSSNNVQQSLLTSKSLVYEDLELDLEGQDPRETRKVSENMREITTNKGLEPLRYIKIVVSGGPCAGKTTSLALVADMLRDRGLVVYIVPEAATLIFNSGGKLDMSSWSESEIIKFQISLLKVQISLEDKFLEFGLCEQTRQPIIILCDRGTMDGKAYISNQDWQIILDELSMTDIQLRDDRYDAVIHLITAADGAEEYYNLNNAARYENNLEIAKKVDKNLQMAWLGHPYRFVIDNKEKGFENKMKKVEEAVFKILSFPGSINFHKKYLMKELRLQSPYENLKRNDSNSALHEKGQSNDESQKNKIYIPENLKAEIFFVEDTFLVKKDPDTTQRIRRRTQNGSSVFIFFENKLILGQNIETKRRISSKDYVTYFAQRDSNRRTITKNRVCFMWNLETYIIEIFQDEKNPKNNFSILIIQTESKENPENIKLPSFILSGVIRDITDEEYYNPYNMSNLTWSLPEEDQDKIYGD